MMDDDSLYAGTVIKGVKPTAEEWQNLWSALGVVLRRTGRVDVHIEPHRKVIAVLKIRTVKVQIDDT
jgi:hypothetical protein